jgi:hypothetical protein
VASEMLFKRLLWYRVIAIGLAIIAVSGLTSAIMVAFLEQKNQELPTTTVMETDSRPLYLCIEHTSQSIKLADTDYYQYERLWWLCGNQVYNQMILADFTIRREKLVRQELDERVTLWMVVSITLSGVLLAALQLLTSYKLAASGHADFAKDSEVVIQRDRISFKSSITGVLILGISLAFFIVYVLWIYTITEVPVERPANLQVAPPIASEIGGVGPPPAESRDARLTSNPIQSGQASVNASRTSGDRPPAASGRSR